jgi:hypothetical protein
LDHPFVILAGEALEIVGNREEDHDGARGALGTRMVEAGYGPTTK